MENETVEVIEPEIVPTEEKDTHVVGNIAIAALAAVGAAKVAKFAYNRMPFTIVRKTKDSETPVVPEPTPAVAAE